MTSFSYLATPLQSPQFQRPFSGSFLPFATSDVVLITKISIILGFVKITSVFSKGLSCSHTIMPLLSILVFMCVWHLCKCPDDCCFTTLPVAWNIHFTRYRLKWQLIFYSLCIRCFIPLLQKLWYVTNCQWRMVVMYLLASCFAWTWL